MGGVIFEPAVIGEVYRSLAHRLYLWRTPGMCVRLSESPFSRDVWAKTERGQSRPRLVGLFRVPEPAGCWVGAAGVQPLPLEGFSAGAGVSGAGAAGAGVTASGVAEAGAADAGEIWVE